MLTDFPRNPSTIKTLLFADDVTIYSEKKLPSYAEITLQPTFNKIYRWGKYAPDKSSTAVFTRAYKPGDDPLLFITGIESPPHPTHKFLASSLTKS